MEQLDLSSSVSSRDGHDPPAAGQPTTGRELSEIRWTTRATELFGRAMGRSMRVRINDFQTRSELAGFWNGKGWKLVTTP